MMITEEALKILVLRRVDKSPIETKLADVAKTNIEICITTQTERR